jgi:dinuclear metal center YbgI/SA1388 family protein
MLISELMSYIEEFAPLSLALDWDNSGLLVGNPESEFKRVLISLDVTPNALRRAKMSQADLILSHHPLIFKPLSSVSDPLLLDLIKCGISVISLHTNLDVAPKGVNHALAKKLGLEVTGHLTSERGGNWYHVSVTVPEEHAGAVAEAAFKEGAGRIGNYSSCSTRHATSGTFKPLAGAKPFLKDADDAGITTAQEEELEFMADEVDLDGVLAAIRSNHPYETPLIYHFPVSAANPAYGLGLVGRFPRELSLEEIRDIVSQRLSCPHPKLWIAGLEPSTKVERIAICGGSGGSILKCAEQKADLLITSDIGYHSYLDSRIPIIDAGHFFTEYPVLDYLEHKLSDKGIRCEVMPMEEHEYWQNIRDI